MGRSHQGLLCAMANCKIQLDTLSVDNAVSSCYLDVHIYTMGNTVKAHKLVLAQRSPWFHRFFQSHTSTEYHVALFNISEQTVRAAIDVMSGKELVMSVRDKNRVVNLMSRLEVKYAEEELTTDRL